MTRVPTIGDGKINRTCWADLADSSQDCSRDETHLVPRAPVADDSYDTPALGVNSKGGLNSMLSRTVLAGPIDFTFLLKDEGKTGSTGSNSPPEASSSSEAGPHALNPSATTFVPMVSASERRLAAQPSSPDIMPPPAIPQASSKSRRIRGKRALSTQQEPPVKRTREQDRKPASSQQRASPPTQEPPPATEEEWQHRIFKRVKVVTSIKETHEYQGYAAARPLEERRDGEPRTPTAEDRNLSKRRWEYEIQQWRNQLKAWAVENLPSDANDMKLDEAGLTAIPEAAGRGSSEELDDEE